MCTYMYCTCLVYMTMQLVCRYWLSLVCVATVNDDS
jgi:hypothetical protein